MKSILIRRTVLALFASVYVFFAIRKGPRPFEENDGSLRRPLSQRMISGSIILIIILMLVTLLLPLLAIIPEDWASQQMRAEDVLADIYLRQGERILRSMLPLFLTILAYDTALLLLTPVLRSRITASGCAAMWFLPGIAFPFLALSNLLLVPTVYLRFGSLSLRSLVPAWLIVALCVLSWRIVSHLLYRRMVLKNARPASENAIRILREERIRLGVLPRGELVVSPDVNVPLSIGVFNSALHIVLPAGREYTEDELRWVLRHEIIHLARQDNLAKLFMTLLLSIGWFLPPQWFGERRAAEEIELSCDEAATSGAESEGVQQYADLLLRSTAPERGFTTNLSTGARGLRYRLERILHQKKRLPGSILAVVLSFVLVFCSGAVAPAYHRQTLTDLIPEENLRLPAVEQHGWGFNSYPYTIKIPSYVKEYRSSGRANTVSGEYVCEDYLALYDYLSQFRIWQVDRNPLGEQDNALTWVGVSFGGPYMKLSPCKDQGITVVYVFSTETYYITDKPIDLAYVRSFAGKNLNVYD